MDKGQNAGDGDVWLGGYPDEPAMFHKLDGETGAIIESFDARTFGCGGYGGLVSDGILWSASLYDNALLRYDLSSETGQCIDVLHSYGLGVDNDGFIWNVMRETGSIAKINPDTGGYAPGFPVTTGGETSRGVAVTEEDNNAWIANSFSDTVTRLDSAGNLIAVIDLSNIPDGSIGEYPTGVAVDKLGKVWVTNRYSDNIMRIDPATNKVDLTVDLGADAEPYNYSDMTGIVLLGHPRIGFWDVVYDGGCNPLWGRIDWSYAVPVGVDGDSAEVLGEVRAAATKAGLTGVPFQAVSSLDDLTGMRGQFMEVRITLANDVPSAPRSPVLYDLTLKHSEADHDCGHSRAEIQLWFCAV